MAGETETIIFLVILAVAAFALFSTLGRGKHSAGRHYRPDNKSNSFPGKAGSSPDIRDAHEQLRIVAKARFEACRVMNLAEYRAFKIVEDVVRAHWPGYRVFSQTSLGEIIRSTDPLAHSCINSKRVDILVVSPSGLPVLVAEYQGGGHFQTSAVARDAVKKEALRKANVAYVEILSSFTDHDILSLIHRELRPHSERTSSDSSFGRRPSPQGT